MSRRRETAISPLSCLRGFFLMVVDDVSAGFAARFFVCFGVDCSESAAGGCASIASGRVAFFSRVESTGYRARREANTPALLRRCEVASGGGAATADGCRRRCGTAADVGRGAGSAAVFSRVPCFRGALEQGCGRFRTALSLPLLLALPPALPTRQPHHGARPRELWPRIIASALRTSRRHSRSGARGRRGTRCGARNAPTPPERHCGSSGTCVW